MRTTASRRRLIEAATRDLVQGHGLLEVSRVAKRAGLSVGLIYRHFGSKAGLVGAVVEDFHHRFACEVMETNPQPGAGWATREHARVMRAVAFHYREPLAPVVLSHLHLEPAVAVTEARQLDRQIELAARNIELGQRAGVLARGLGPRFAAAMVLGGLRRVLVDALGRNPRPQQELVAAELWRFVAAILGLDSPARLRGGRFTNGRERRSAT